MRKDDITPSFTGVSFNLAADANWTSFLSHVGASHLADIKWNVIAADTNAGSIDSDPVSYPTTGAATGVPAGATNTQPSSWGGNSTLHSKKGPADFASFEVSEGLKWGGKSNFDTTAGLANSFAKPW